MEDEFILQYVSDIHLELRKSKDIPAIFPIRNYNCYLALCGDIGNPFKDTYKMFLDIHTKLYTHILIISGNHEYHSSKTKQYTMKDADNKINEIVKQYNNVTYLNMNKVIIGRTKFIGCTFWSDISKILSIAENIMNDYKHIYIDSQGISARNITTTTGIYCDKKRLNEDRIQLRAQNVLELHKMMKKWILSEVGNFDPNDSDIKYDQIIVLTHHPPSFKMLDINDLYSPCYGSNCDDMIKPPIKYWISGHTHSSKNLNINGTICLSNCMGYPDQRVVGYSNDKYITFS